MPYTKEELAEVQDENGFHYIPCLEVGDGRQVNAHPMKKEDAFKAMKKVEESLEEAGLRMVGYPMIKQKKGNKIRNQCKGKVRNKNESRKMAAKQNKNVILSKRGIYENT